MLCERTQDDCRCACVCVCMCYITPQRFRFLAYYCISHFFSSFHHPPFPFICLPGTLMILKSACSYNASYIDRLISVFMRSLQKMVREHLSPQQANPGVTETSTGTYIWTWIQSNIMRKPDTVIQETHMQFTLYKHINNTIGSTVQWNTFCWTCVTSIVQAVLKYTTNTHTKR